MQPYIVCQQCGALSHHPKDVSERYCGACHEFHDQMTPRPALASIVVAGQTAGVPPHLLGGLARYICEGILPGGFLQAVLCNDLQQAILRADPLSLRALPELVVFLTYGVPPACWRSREAVLTWTVTPDRLEI